MSRTSKIALFMGTLAIIGAAFAAWYVLRPAEADPFAPREIVWGKQVCDRCGMHISEPGFAAQLHTSSGQVLLFDDPGCLFNHEPEISEPIARRYYHHTREAAWLSEEQAGFVEVMHSPMGYNLGAVARSEEGAMTPDEARERAARGKAHHQAP